MTLGAGMSFALNGTASKLLLRGGFDPPGLTTFRATGACLGLLALCAVTPGGIRRLRLRRRELPSLLGFGLTGFFVVPMLYFVAITRLPIGIGLLFEFTAPVFIALWVRFGERGHVRARLWLGLVLCLGGLAAVAEVWAGELRLDPWGVAAGLGAAVLLAVYYVLGSRSVADRDPISLTCWAFAVAAVAGCVVRPWWTLPWASLGREVDTTPMWWLAVYLLVLGTITPYLLVTAAMRHLPATSVGIIGTVEPVLASGFAWVLLGEVLVAPQMIGGLIVLAGVILAETARAGGASRGGPSRAGPHAPAAPHPAKVPAEIPPT
jgi:drug/metabolite transporter (DMT)-like permease